ncbi:hydroxysqualene dehydroxylase HpnE [Oxalobacter vibrioformis]|uniref:Hydroxysqualene dehydroxylase HpnE n=1 Tax=Oxalobacter vibrioformis TaxID=933080 RepID=A0A9E9LV53_9BURK|nr:hydroxysqualene dehydroxylase HpnE [Oxalobacter vibrioformis]WAW10265.1 hydroxysqualene dehydroxylase HpnE [Oxalobacter vibrioformis]
MSVTDQQKVAVIGAGWAGCAAAVALADAGAAVTVFESRTTPGGRARRVEADGRTLDNGQHILLGAYTETLRLMKKVGVNPDTALLRLPLQMCYPPGTDGMAFVTSALPAPLHLLGALLRADGLEMADKIALARFTSAARWINWTLNEDCAVTTLLERFDQTVRLYRLLWKPLCISALNTLPEQASAQIFLNILRDSIGARRAASDMLIPRLDFSALFPDPALAFVRQRGSTVIEGKTVRSLCQTPAGWEVDSEVFDAVVVATSAAAASTLLSRQMDMVRFDALEFEPIHTCYFGYSPDTRLPRAFFALKDDAQSGKWGQFVFDRGWLDVAHAGIFAVVISTSSSTSSLTRQALEADVARQLADQLKMPQLAFPLWAQTVSERQATFVCKPALVRPEMKSGLPGLVFAGDYVRSEYPGTLESAARSGVQAAACVLAGDWG